MVRNRIGRTGLLIGGAAAALLLAACNPGQTAGEGQGTSPTVPTFSSSPSDVSSSTASEPSDTDSTATSSPSGDSGGSGGSGSSASSSSDCKAADLALKLHSKDAGAGHTYFNLEFNNKGSRTCTIQGYPGVSYVTGDSGRQVGAAAYREGHKGAVVTLHPGGSAYAPIDEVQVHNFDPAACKPTSTRGLRIYPPHDTASMFVAQSGTGCTGSVPGHQLSVKTVLPGTGA